MTIQTQQNKPDGSMEAFARAFSDVIKDATSHLATKEDINDLSDRIDTTNENMQAQFARQEERIDSLSRDIGTTNRNMQAQFARQEEKIAEIARKLD